MKKILLILTLVMGCMTAYAAKNYNIIGVYHDAFAKHPSTWRIITTDNQVGVHKMTLKPARIREKQYEVEATLVAENVYMIEGKTFHAKLYIEVENCSEEADHKEVLMVIENIRGKVKGRLIFE